jgi:hypothetical protein
MSGGLEIRAQIDTETVRALLLVNGGAAAGLMAMLPNIVDKPGLAALAYGSMGAIAFGALVLALAIVHNRLRRKCSLRHEARDNALKASRNDPSLQYVNPHPPYSGWLARLQTLRDEPKICTWSGIMMWLSLVAFVCAGGCVAGGAWKTLPLGAAPPRAQEAVRSVPRHGALVPLNIDHAERGWEERGGYICVFNFDIGARRYRADVNAGEPSGCPQVIWAGERP